MAVSPKIITVPVLLGPTAAGKTDFAVQYAHARNMEIVSCDSRQIYQYMDIGTAKPSAAQLRLVTHHLVSCIDPATEYSAYSFMQDAGAVLRRCAAQGKAALVCGGTGLYYQALSEGIAPTEESDAQVRADLTQRAHEQGTLALHRQLQACDPGSASRIHPNDLQRIIRALSVWCQTGESMSSRRAATVPPGDFRCIPVVLAVPREELYRRINQRVVNMFDRGLWEEFLGLLRRGYTKQSPGMHCVGYRELFAVAEGVLSRAGAIELIQRNTRRYAKRQITWFSNKIKDVVVFDQTAGYEIFEKYFDHLLTTTGSEGIL
jgi:tRNA dimethylallyltransferase